MTPRFLAAATVFFWSFGMLFGRIMSHSSGFFLVSLSFFFSSATFFVYCVFSFRKKCFQQLCLIDLKDIAAGLCGYLIYWIFLILSFTEFNRAAEPTLLNYTWPVFTVLFSSLLYRPEKTREKLLYESSGIFLCFLSVCIIFLSEIQALEMNVRGILYGLAAGMSYGFFSAYSARIQDEKNPVFLFWASGISCVLLAGFVIFRNQYFLPTAKQLWVVCASGALVDGLGYMMWTLANYRARILNISISSIASIMFLLPFFSLLLVSFFLNDEQIFRPMFLLSLCLVLTGLYLCSYQKNPQPVSEI